MSFSFGFKRLFDLKYYPWFDISQMGMKYFYDVSYFD